MIQHVRVARFLGCLNRRPYLWFVDTETRAIEPAAATLDAIPQGISEVVPFDEETAVGCGPHWFALGRDLSGTPATPRR